MARAPSAPAQQLCLRAWHACRAELAASSSSARGAAQHHHHPGSSSASPAAAISAGARHLSHAAASTSGRGVIGSLAQQHQPHRHHAATTKLQALARRWMSAPAAATAATADAAAASASAAAASLLRQPRVTGARALARDLKQLSKARLSLLVALTASTGYVLGDAVEGRQQQDGPSAAAANDATPPPPKTRAEWWRGLAATTAGTWLAAASANALNQLYETRNDAAMKRTCLRPLPAGRLSAAQAGAFALLSGLAGVGLLARETNATTAGLGAANIALYAGVYTPLKQVTAANTWVGAVVGAIPPLMGWAAATMATGAATGHEEEGAGSSSPSPPPRWWSSFGAELRHPGAWVLALSLFSWQMPHFMALAWLCRDDYRAGGFKMLSLAGAGVGGAPSAAGATAAAATTSTTTTTLASSSARELAAGRRVAAVALRHSLALVPLGAAAAWLGLSEPGWHSSCLAAEAGALAAAMVAASAAFWARPDAASARRAFRASLAYLPLLMLGMVVHRRRAAEEAPLLLGAEEAQVLRAGAAAAAATAPLPPPRTWGEVRDRLAGAGWWWSPDFDAPATMSVRLRLRSPEERVAGAVLVLPHKREEEEAAAAAAVLPPPPPSGAVGGGGGAGELIAELRAALGLTHCPSRVYGEAIEEVEEVEEEEAKEDDEEERAGGRRRR